MTAKKYIATRYLITYHFWIKISVQYSCTIVMDELTVSHVRIKSIHYHYQGRSHQSGIKVFTWPLFFQATWTLASLDHLKMGGAYCVRVSDITVISCAWIFWSYYDKTSHLDCRYLTFTPQNAPEMLSDGQKIQNFPGGACPQTPRA